MMKQIIEEIRIMLYIVCILAVVGFFFYEIVSFGKSLDEECKKREKQERMSFIKDSLEAEYLKLKIDSSNGK